MAKILVVDDSISVRKGLERILSKQGYEVETAEDAEKALDVIDPKQHDLVITDVLMPGIDGFELCARLKANPNLSHLPVFVMSGLMNEGFVAQAATVKADEVVTKPFSEDVMPKIAEALEQASQRKVAPPIPTPVEVPRVPTASAPENLQTRLNRALKPLLDLPQVESAVLLNAEGDYLMSLGSELEAAATLASYFKFFVSASNIMSEHLSGSYVQTVLLEYDDKRSIMIRKGETLTIASILISAQGQDQARTLLAKHLTDVEKAITALPSAVN